MISLLLITAIATEVSGQPIFNKEACNGESFMLLKYSSPNIARTTVSIHKDHTVSATWILTNSTIDQVYAGKVFPDGGGNIWIVNITPSDEGIYTVTHLTGNITSASILSRVKLTVLVAPSTNCKPKINRADMLLTASVEVAECGKPPASAYFVEYPDISYDSKSVMKLSPGKEAKTYIACIETPALNCARRFKPFEFCTYFTIHESNSQVYERSRIDIVTVIQLIMLLFIFIIVLYGCPKPCSKKKCAACLCPPRSNGTNENRNMISHEC